MKITVKMEHIMNKRTKEMPVWNRDALFFPPITRESPSDNSVPELMNQLCVKLCEDVDESSIIKRRKIVKKLKTQAFQLLLKDSVPNLNKDCDNIHKDELLGTLIHHVYGNAVHSSTWTKQKNQELSEVVDILSNKMNEQPYIESVLKFLISMSASADTPVSKIRYCGLDVVNHQLESRLKSMHSLSGIHNSNVNVSSRSYLGYVPSIFDAKMIVDSPFNSCGHISKMSDITDFPFESEPGTGLRFFEKFGNLLSSGIKSSRNMTDICGQQRTKSLSIPELSVDLPRSLTIPSLKSSHLDEGYVTPDKEFVDDHDRDSSVSKKTRSDVWNILTTESLAQPLCYAWESPGRPKLGKEPPFLLESDIDVIECWKKQNPLLNRDSCGFVLDNSDDENLSSHSYHSCHNEEFAVNFGDLITISFQEFFRDVKCLLIAIASKTFYFDEGLNTFAIKPGVSLPGITPEGLEVYSKDLIECANNFRSLDLLIKTISSNMALVVNDSNDTNCTLPTTITSVSDSNITFTSAVLRTDDAHRGLVFEAMCTSVRSWLQAYRGVVIKNIDTESSTLLDVKLWLQPLQQQLRFLVDLCCPSDPNFKLPTGGALLTRIYNIVQITVSEPFACILYHILENCLKVYFRFLENWLFEGICDDIYGEFFIEQKTGYEAAKDRSYWRRMYSIRRDRVPIFLSDLVNDIFICGKTLNLVKLCNPNDPFCQRLASIYPRMSPCFEETSLDKLDAEFHQFVVSCEHISAEFPLPKLFSPESDSEENKESHFETISLQKAKSLDKIKKAKEERYKKKNEKKQELFEAAKNEMLEAEKRKREEKQTRLNEEKKRLGELAEAAEIEARKKDNEKQRVIEYYKSLSDAADNRKFRAEWKMKRLKLNDKRIDFLVEDKQNIREELFKSKLTKSLTNVENNNPVTDSGEPSPTSSSSWLTCPSNSIENCVASKDQPVRENTLNVIIQDDLGNVIETTDCVDNYNRYRRTGSFSNILDKEDSTENVVSKNRKSSSDTNIYANFSCDSLNSKNNLNKKNCNDTFNNDKNDEDNTSYLNDDIKLTDNMTKLSKTDDVKDLSKTVSLNLENSSRNEVTGFINNRSDNIASLFNVKNSDKSESAEHILSPKITNENLTLKSKKSEIDFQAAYDYEGEENQVVLNKLFSETRNAALLNKQKVYEDEYGIDVKFKTDTEEEDFSRCKNRVLEMKMKMNETAVKERTEELALARSNLLDARKQAARNKARVMSSEYSIFGNSRKSEKEHLNKTVVNKSFDQLTDKVICVKEYVHNFDDNISGKESESETCKTAEPTFSFFNSEFIDSEGRFIYDKKPLIIDIADKILSPNSDSSLNIKSTNYTTIHYCLHKSVAIPTEIQKKFTNDAILRLFIINEKLLDHLQCIRSYFFLMDGEYGRILTRNLFEDLEVVEQPSGLLTYLRLNSILRSASRPHLNESFTNRLSFFVKETPLVFVLTDPDVLNCLSMRYHVHWPLNVILTNDAIINYDKVFAFQLKLQRALWTLEQDMHLLKMRNMMRSSHYRQLQIFRHTMIHFVGAISNYITRVALEETWVEFKNNISKADTLDALYEAHVNYIKSTLFRCLLNKRSETIQKAIMGLLRNILSFHELLRTGEWVYDLETGDHTHSAFTRLAHQYSTFVRTLRHLIKFLNQVIGRGYQPHLDVLITFLSGNDFYFRDI